MDAAEAISSLKSLETLGIRFRIENTQELLDLAGYDFAGFVIHVGGTNGKGSAASALAHILKSSGMSVGLYTSPELFDFSERIKVDGRSISPEDLVRLTEGLMPVISSMVEPPTFFEATTALALLYFAGRGVDAMVLEAGMGGRLDSTNAIPASHTIITNIGLDHMQYLGDTLEEIALEKAGLISEGSHLVTCAKGPALKVLKERAASAGAAVLAEGEDFSVAEIVSSLEGTSFSFEMGGRKLMLSSPMSGSFQAYNIAAAAACAIAIGISDAAITSGVGAARMPARLELCGTRPHIIVDAAHNPDGIGESMGFLASLGGFSPLVVLCGFSKDKDYASMAKKLAGADSIVATGYGGQRSLDPARIGELTGAIVIDDPDKALEKAISLAGDTGLVYVGGSIYLAARALARLKKIK